MRGRRRRGRGFRRFLRPLRRRPSAVRVPLAGPLLDQLRNAHRLLEGGDSEAAARSFQELASIAEAKGHPQAARLSLKAGRCWIEAGEVDRGVRLLDHGLRHLASHASPARIQQVASRVSQGLRSQGLETEADEIQALLQELGAAAEVEAPAQPRHELPAKCPQCGGPVRSDEVEWTAEGQAVCDYCGSQLRAGE